MFTPIGRLAFSRPRTLPVLGLVLTAAIFAADLGAPIGSAIGMLYVGVVLLGLWSPQPAFPLVAAYVATVLVLADLYAGWNGQLTLGVIVNYPLMILVFLISAIVVRRFVALEGRAAAHFEQLGDFKRALDASAIVATTDVKGRITYVNDKFLEISGYSREELLGQDHRIINSAYHSPEFIRDLWRTIANGHVWHGEIRNRAKAGHFYWVDTTIVPFVTEEGKPYQYIAIRADVTARKTAEDSLTHQAALARVGQMAAVLAHEVRNPLAGIRGAMQVLLGRRKADDPERAVMQEILARTESLNELIDDLLLFARPRPPRPAEVELTPLLHDVFATVLQDPAGKGVEFEAVGAPLTVLADADLTRATILNLVLNAAQALAGHGRITVFSTPASGGMIEVQVRDTGPGIPLEIREQVFEPFFTTKSRGGGLGLPIAQRTVELHGGSLSVHCPPEGGTVFTLTLPRATGSG
ncbi:Sensor protein ZraS [Luteitalea pratensis]|uniref:histidine kinase n=1 Tax=Luteitalea pratensis TaxID=1855912 RepID=A0A143PHU5_LUTPR|nr:PAS domain-containing sensor histidine kinase [Luteitalea pratensis]AMY08091.1 Sensor protein ZraS [Luteitalea pratensis]